METLYGLAAGFALFCLTQTILFWIKLAGIEAKVDVKLQDLYHHLNELQELHPRRGNPGEPKHDGGEHPHDVGGDGLAC